MAVSPAPGRVEDLRAANRAVLLNLARTLRTMPRRALANQSGLSRAAAYAIANDLQRAGILANDGIGTSSGGRRPQLLRFVPDAWLAIGIEMGERDLTVVVTDLDGTVLHRDQVLADSLAPSDAVAAAAAAVARLRTGFAGRRFLGIGFASPGTVDMDAGRVRGAVSYDWHDVPLADLLRERTGLPVFVANRSKAAALGELLRGAGVGARHLVYLYAGRGIATGIVVDGELYVGAASAAGEVGHVTILPDGPPCECGNRGCLHTVASGAVLLEQARAALAAGHDGGGLRRRAPDPQALTTLELARAAREGDPIAVRLVRAAGRHLGIAAASLLNTLNPDRFVLGGPLTEAGPTLLEPFLAEVEERALASTFASARLLVSVLGADAGSVGAASLVVRRASLLIDQAMQRL